MSSERKNGREREGRTGTEKMSEPLKKKRVHHKTRERENEGEKEKERERSLLKD